MKEKKGSQKLCKLHFASLKLFLILLYFKLHTVNPAIFWHGISNAIDKYWKSCYLCLPTGRLCPFVNVHGTWVSRLCWPCVYSFGVSAPPRLQFRVRTLLGIRCIVELNEKLNQSREIVDERVGTLKHFDDPALLPTVWLPYNSKPMSS